jgi:UDP-N-acetylmuramyl pentapeptide synthase
MKPAAIVPYGDAKEISSDIRNQLKENDLVLLKASRSVRLEEVAQVILEGQDRPPFRLAQAG